MRFYGAEKTSKGNLLHESRYESIAVIYGILEIVLTKGLPAGNVSHVF